MTEYAPCSNSITVSILSNIILSLQQLRDVNYFVIKFFDTIAQFRNSWIVQFAPGRPHTTCMDSIWTYWQTFKLKSKLENGWLKRNFSDRIGVVAYMYHVLVYWYYWYWILARNDIDNLAEVYILDLVSVILKVKHIASHGYYFAWFFI